MKLTRPGRRRAFDWGRLRVSGSPGLRVSGSPPLYMKGDEMKERTYSGVGAHIYYDNGSAKTVCTSFVLGALGVHPGTYRYSARRGQWSAVLRRNGYKVRSRQSHTKGAATVGAVRRLIRERSREKWGDPPGAKYLIMVRCGAQYHLLLMSNTGKTLVDTAPRVRDRRAVVGVQVAFK